MTTKRPWMPLYIDDYLGATAHLEAHEHGAYLLLMMHYWRERSLPTDDEIIRKISRLSIRQWRRARPLIRSFFGDDWKHARIDKELAKVIEKSKVNSANAAKSHEDRKPVARKSHSGRTANVVAIADTLQTSNLRSPSGGQETTPPETASRDIGKALDPNFQPPTKAIERAHDQGLTDADIDAELIKFVAKYRHSFGDDWDGSFETWIEREIAHRAKARPKAPPRIDYGTIDWGAFCQRFIGGMGWPRNIGPDPESAACRCPVEVLRKYGLRSVPAEAAS